MTDTTIYKRQPGDKTSQSPAAAPLEREKLLPPEPPPIKPRKFAPPDYYVLPYAFCIDPPVQPRRGNDADRLSPFEMQIAAAVISVARIEQAQSMKALAFEAAHEKIVEERETAKYYRRHLQAKKKDKFTPRMSRGAVIRGLGSHSNHAERQKLRQAGPADTVQVAITIPNLLAVAYADRHCDKRLPGALDRLTQAQPLHGRPPLLSGWRQHGRTLLLDVAGAWVDPRLNVRKKAAPLPVASPTTLALFIFASTVATDVKNRRNSKAGAAIPWEVLCKKLCMHPDTRPSRCEDILARAYAEVNAHLKTFDRAKRVKLAKGRIYPPRSYTVHTIEADDPRAWRYRFEYIPINAGDDDEAAVAPAPKVAKAAAPKVDPQAGTAALQREYQRDADAFLAGLNKHWRNG